MEEVAMRRKKKKWDRKFWIPTIIELIGIGLMCTGLGYEMAYHADLGYIIMTTGSVLIAAGGVLYAKFKPWLEG